MPTNEHTCQYLRVRRPVRRQTDMQRNSSVLSTLPQAQQLGVRIYAHVFAHVCTHIYTHAYKHDYMYANTLKQQGALSPGKDDPEYLQTVVHVSRHMHVSVSTQIYSEQIQV